MRYRWKTETEQKPKDIVLETIGNSYIMIKTNKITNQVIDLQSTLFHFEY